MNKKHRAIQMLAAAVGDMYFKPEVNQTEQHKTILGELNAIKPESITSMMVVITHKDAEGENVYVGVAASQPVADAGKLLVDAALEAQSQPKCGCVMCEIRRQLEGTGVEVISLDDLANGRIRF